MDKKFKRIISVFLTILMLFNFLTPVFAENESTQPQKEATLNLSITSDKDKYTNDETIIFSISVKNNNRFTVENTDITNILDFRLQAISGSATIVIDSIPAGETITKNIKVTKSDLDFDGNNGINKAFNIITTIINYFKIVIGSALASVMPNIDICSVIMGKSQVSILSIAHGYVGNEAEEPSDENDTDADKLSDNDEAILGTDKNNPDTDDDNFTDYEEVILMGTNPLIPNNSSEDTDEDGLTNDDEVNQYGTDINAVDTDDDELNDYDEVHIYKTDPTNPDTDGDELSDGFEIKHSLNPLKESTNGKDNDGDIKIEQEISDEGISNALIAESNLAKPSICGKAAGELSDNVFLSKSNDSAFDDNRAIIGEAVQVDGENDYLNGLALSFDLSSYKGDLSDMIIANLDADGNMVPVDSSLDTTTLSCKLTESGTYCVLNLSEFLDSLGIDLSEYWSETRASTRSTLTFSSAKVKSFAEKATISGQADIVFAIDTTGSMSSAIDNVAENVTSFVTTLSNDYNVKVNFALVDFKDLEEDGPGTTVVVKNGSSNWFSDVDSFANKVNSLVADGGGDTPECDVDALETARRLDFRKAASKFIILITDTYFKTANNYEIESMEEEINLLKKDEIVTSVVSDTYYQDTYNPLYETTGGIFADISSSSFGASLLALANLIGETTSNGTWVILKHGYKYVKLTDEDDQDADGIPTTTELGAMEEIDLSPFIKAQLALHGVPFSEYRDKTSITVYNAKSDPTKHDTDDDGINDDEDTAPWTKGLAGGIIGTIQVCASDEGYAVSSLWNTGGHGWLVYKSYIDDSVPLNSGLYATISDSTLNYSEINTLNLNRNEVVTIGSWGNHGEKRVYVNLEMIYGSTNFEDYYSISHSVTSSQLEQLCNYTQKHDKWTEFKNCSYYASNAWNAMFDDNLSAMQISIFGTSLLDLVCTPRHLANNIKKRNGWSKNEKFGVASFDFNQSHTINDYTEKNQDYSYNYDDIKLTSYDGHNGRVDLCIPGLSKNDKMVPQGLAYYPTKDWFLISSYSSAEPQSGSVIFALNASNGRLQTVFKLKNTDGSTYKGHAGGIGVSNNNLYMTISGSKIGYIPLSELNCPVGTSKTLQISDTIDLSDYLGGTKASYLTVNNNVLCTGNFYHTTDDYNTPASPKANSVVLTFDLQGNSSANEWKTLKESLTPSTYYLPNTVSKVQSAIIVDNDMYISSSYGRRNDSTIYVVDLSNNSTTISKDNVKGYTAMPMTEGLTTKNGEVFFLTESAAYEYLNKDPLNVSKNPTDVIWKIN